jgi:hypothetical protein
MSRRSLVLSLSGLRLAIFQGASIFLKVTKNR